MQNRNSVEYELVILGNGAAAFAAAIKADELGKKTAMIKGGTIGGTCVNVGCVPSKRLLVSGEVIRNTRNHNLGENAIAQHDEEFEFAKVMEFKNKLVENLRYEKYENVLSKLKNVELYEGIAGFISEKEVEIRHNSKNTVISGKKFVIATGASSSIPKLQGIDSIDYWTNIEGLEQEKVPESLIVIGGRALGLEFAQMYNRFGTKVTLLQRSPSLIPEEEPEMAKALKSYLEEDGIAIHTAVDLKSFEKNAKNNQVIVNAEVNGKQVMLEASSILFATGRTPNTKSLNVENAKIKLGTKGEIIIDSEMKTNNPNIFAAGDVTGEPMLESLAAREGTYAAENAILSFHKKIDTSIVPKAIFTDPQFASVGITEKEVIERFKACTCRLVKFTDVPKAIIMGDTRGMIKMVAHPETHVILGVQILSPMAAEIIHEAVMILKNGYRIEDVIDTIHVFPTMSESLKIVAQSFFRNIKDTSCCI
ncbi:MAG: mercury(II) reductase [Candidatus Marsarchaeota archaeon]|nr:mercury(II) reductase [Candidatus Marsarchaeota archaeon]